MAASTKYRVRMIDPPSGWMYGFPKVYDNEEGVPVEEWLVKNGYSAEEFDDNGKVYWCRFFTADGRSDSCDSPCMYSGQFDAGCRCRGIVREGNRWVKEKIDG